MMLAFASGTDLGLALARVGYLADDRLSLVCWLALALDRPLLVEGPAGVGKTDLARALAEALSREHLRLQCYEGMDEAKALYEWDYAKQMLYAQLLRDTVATQAAGSGSLAEAVDRTAGVDTAFFGERFLIKRPLLRALTHESPVVMLIDEVDRSDPEFEAFLLEVLSEGQVTIPELGTVRAKNAPLFILTSNGTREMTDALRRRCLHAFIDYPPPAREQAIIRMRVPGIGERLADQLSAFVQKARSLDLRKAPSIAETIDWAKALVLLGSTELDAEIVSNTLGVLVKHDDDRQKIEAKFPVLLTGKR